MSATLEIIVAYLLRVAPGLALAAILLFLLRNQPRLRIVLYLALFVLLRDAMTPLGLWSFGTEGFFWIRLHTDPWFLIAFGVSCLTMSLLAYYLDRANQPLFQWRRGNLLVGVIWGLGGALLVVAPFVILYRFTPIASRGGPVPVQNLAALFVFAFLGNLSAISSRKRFSVATCSATSPSRCRSSRPACSPASSSPSATSSWR